LTTPPSSAQKPVERHTAVAVIGGGYGGFAVAKGLDEFADVTLVEPRDAFVHNVAALRALVPGPATIRSQVLWMRVGSAWERLRCDPAQVRGFRDPIGRLVRRIEIGALLPSD
jgi:2-polyprenyl-6-methoxyphenol hydroxylase-like FAD-dependent oxidoreductase